MAAASRGLYIAGTWRPASGGGTIDVIDPSTEHVIAKVPDATVEDALAAVTAAANAAAGWRTTAPRKRARFCGAVSNS